MFIRRELNYVISISKAGIEIKSINYDELKDCLLRLKDYLDSSIRISSTSSKSDSFILLKYFM